MLISARPPELSVSNLSSRLAWVCIDNTIKEYQNIGILKGRKRSRIGCFSGKGFPFDFLFQWKNNTPFFPSGKIFWNRLFPGNFHGKFTCFFHGKYPFWSGTSTVCFDSWVPCLNKTLLSRNYEYFGFGFNLNVASKRSLCLETIMRLESFHLSRLKLCSSHFS